MKERERGEWAALCACVSVECVFVRERGIVARKSKMAEMCDYSMVLEL